MMRWFCSEQYEQFLKLLMETMKVDGVDLDLDLGVDMRLRLIQSRAEQLVKQEGTAVVENKTLAYSLQRKVSVAWAHVKRCPLMCHFTQTNANFVTFSKASSCPTKHLNERSQSVDQVSLQLH